MNENSMSFFKCYATSMECQSTNVVLCTLTMIDLKISTDTIVKPLHVIHQRCYKIRHTRFKKYKRTNNVRYFSSKLNIIFWYWCHRFKIPFFMRKHFTWCFFTKMIFSTLPRFIYKHETAGNPCMYLYKNYITCLCINPL